MPEGSITLSFDCEGKWGMTDIHTPWDENLTRSSLLSAYDFILQTLEKYDIRATFGFVGALTVTREEFLEVSYPNLFSASYASWLGPSRDRILKKSEEGWFLPELLDMVKGQQKHEIASHGYTHIPFSLLSEPDVQLELGMVLSWAEKKNIDCSTFIFPRNLVYHQNILKDFGIFGYRDTPISVFGTGVPKYLRTLAEEIWIFQKSEKLKEGAPVRIPGGAFINWKSGFRRAIPASLSMLKYKSMIANSVKRDEVAHFWIHPHNLITSPQTKKLFSDLCAQIALCKNSMPLVIKRQKDYLDLLPCSNSIDPTMSTYQK